ncbi:MarR family winged helix-turn-helix transcriptional regulator [Jatrophihabitans endophyticus]|uniref:MarR family winged helix-turn-helix transcriptional regulator n=1 Tax=Jatrophihabitans endophyticus TaxID=1206085 RepID=UPI0019DE2AB6|nr:MarR family transcriptional regulator [Jatrophihabitans endophyticus]MBE7188922.1 MarR family transcriptional regulator [Jatrophihabitans endophyticus]
MAEREVSPVEVGQAYFELHHLMHRIVDRTMSCEGLSFARTKVLMRIANEGPMNQATLAGLLGFAPRSVTETVDALEREGLVTRTEDPHDRRARIVAITPAGTEAHEAAMAVKAKAMTEIFGSLTTEQRGTLLSLFDSIRSTLVPGDTCS